MAFLPIYLLRYLIMITYKTLELQWQITHYTHNDATNSQIDEFIELFPLKKLQVFVVTLKSWYFHYLSLASANLFSPSWFKTSVPSWNPPSLPNVFSETPWIFHVSPLSKHLIWLTVIKSLTWVFNLTLWGGGVRESCLYRGTGWTEFWGAFKS